MNAKFNGEKWVVDVTGQQFQEMVEGFFKRNPVPTCDELKNALVPVGVPNTATEGSFGKNGIFKFVFMSSDGIDLMVKYHDIDRRVAAKFPGNNAALYWTAQILCNKCSYFTWDAKKNKAGVTPIGEKKVRDGVAPRENAAHIPLRSGPSIGTEDQTHLSKVSLAGVCFCTTLLLFFPKGNQKFDIVCKII